VISIVPGRLQRTGRLLSGGPTPFSRARLVGTAHALSAFVP